MPLELDEVQAALDEVRGYLQMDAWRDLGKGRTPKGKRAWVLQTPTRTAFLLEIARARDWLADWRPDLRDKVMVRARLREAARIVHEKP